MAVAKLLDITFKSEKEQGLEEYMAAQKVGFMLRKVAKNLTIYETLTKEGDTYTYDFTSTFVSSKITFKLGETFENKGADGRTMKTTFFEEGDKFICTMEAVKDGDVPCRIERRILADGNLEATMISTPTNTICKRTFVVHKKL